VCLEALVWLGALVCLEALVWPRGISLSFDKTARDRVCPPLPQTDSILSCLRDAQVLTSEAVAPSALNRGGRDALRHVMLFGSGSWRFARLQTQPSKAPTLHSTRLALRAKYGLHLSRKSRRIDLGRWWTVAWQQTLLGQISKFQSFALQQTLLRRSFRIARQTRMFEWCFQGALWLPWSLRCAWQLGHRLPVGLPVTNRRSSRFALNSAA